MNQSFEKQLTFFKTGTEAFINLARLVTSESSRMQSLNDEQKKEFYESFYQNVLSKMQEGLESFDKIEK